MAQINLLKHTSSPEQQFGSIAGVVVKILVVVVVAMLGFYAFLWVQIGSESKKEAAAQEAILKEQKKAQSFEGIDELNLRQQQIKEFAALLDQHVYWTTFFPVLAKHTFINSKYSSIQALEDGTMTMTVTVPDMKELDKLLQVFNVPEVNKSFRNVTIGSLTREYSETFSTVKVELRFDYNKDLLQYKQQYDVKK
jgi:hypothetical protein